MFKLPKLNYDYNALEPFIDEATMTIHHSKHHQAYVDNLNKAIEGTEYENMEIGELIKKISELPENIKTAVKNNGGGHYNHGLYWNIMGPNAAREPKGELLEKINESFGSFENLKKEIEAAGATQFGSGWAWLVINGDKLEVVKTANQDNPLSEGKFPILGVDVWEHAYYLKYQNKRPEYLKNWWNIVNWDAIEKLYEDNK